MNEVYLKYNSSTASTVGDRWCTLGVRFICLGSTFRVVFWYYGSENGIKLF